MTLYTEQVVRIRQDLFRLTEASLLLLGQQLRVATTGSM
jgi:hypothetical protein